MKTDAPLPRERREVVISHSSIVFHFYSSGRGNEQEELQGIKVQ